jgi:hypothetical protein
VVRFGNASTEAHAELLFGKDGALSNNDSSVVNTAGHRAVRLLKKEKRL